MKRIIIPGIILLIIIGVFSGCQNAALSSAKLYIQQANYDAAIEQCQIALSQNPENAEAYFVLGNAYASKGMFKEMNDAYNNSLERSDKKQNEIDQTRLKYWIDNYNNGVNQTKQDQLEEAAESFTRATIIQPDNVDAYKNLAYVYDQLGQMDKAVEVYQKFLEISPGDLETQNTLGLLYFKNKQYDDAIATLSEVVSEADPQSDIYKQALFNLAYSYDLKGEPEKAVETYDNALEISPNDLDLLFNIGRIYYVQENYEKSIEYFGKVLDINADDFEANFNIGVAYIQLEKFAEAIPSLEKAAELVPDNANAWNNLAIAYVRAGFPEKGKAAFDKADALKGTQ